MQNPASLPACLPDPFIWAYWQAAATELGIYSLNMILLKAGLDRLVVVEKSLPRREPVQTEEFARVQQTLLAYYGQGARGLLLRIGRRAWLEMDRQPGHRVVERFSRFLPLSFKVHWALQALAAALGAPSIRIEVQQAGKEFTLSHFCCLAAGGQQAGDPCCWTMIGLIRGALECVGAGFLDVYEETCQASGAEACRFRIGSPEP